MRDDGARLLDMLLAAREATAVVAGAPGGGAVTRPTIDRLSVSPPRAYSTQRGQRSRTMLP